MKTAVLSLFLNLKEGEKVQLVEQIDRADATTYEPIKLPGDMRLPEKMDAIADLPPDDTLR